MQSGQIAGAAQLLMVDRMPVTHLRGIHKLLDGAARQAVGFQDHRLSIKEIATSGRPLVRFIKGVNFTSSNAFISATVDYTEEEERTKRRTLGPN